MALTVLALVGALIGCDLNKPVDIEVPQRAAERIGILDASGDGITGWKGSDLTLYSDDGVTAKFAVDGATGNVIAAGNVTTAGTLAVTGAPTFTGAATLSGGAVVAGWSELTPAAAITVTQGMTDFVPLGSVQPIKAASAVSFTGIGGLKAGRVLVLFNEGDQTITITDTTTTMLSGNLALAQYDSVALISDGTNWIQLSTSNN